MCFHLTLAVRNREALAPLRELGVDLESAEHPRLPPDADGLRLFRICRGWCACDLFRADWRASLAAALATVAAAEPLVLAHRTWGDVPNGSRPVRALEPHDVAAFAGGGEAVDDRWVRLRVPFAPGAPFPHWIDGARVLAAAAAKSDGPVLAIVRYPFTPGTTLLRCDARWTVLGTEWYASPEEACAAAAEAHGRLAWSEVGDDRAGEDARQLR